MINDYTNKKLFDLTKTQAERLFKETTYPWEVLPLIGDFIVELGKNLSEDEYYFIEPDIWISKKAKVFESAYIKGPCIIGAGTEVRHCAFIRGNVLVGENCVVGNSTECKNIILFDNVQVPHYNYVGDSILGYKSHMGCGSICSNVKSDKTLVKVKSEGEELETGLKKFGAILGDYCEIGCSSVLNPGTVIGRESNVYPLSSVRGCIPSKHIFKNSENIVKKN